MRRFLFSGLMLVSALFAQAPPKANVPMPADEAAYKKALAISASAGQLAAILQFLSDYPNSRSVPLMIGRGFGAAELVGLWNSARAVEFAGDVARRLARASPMARSEAAKAIALRLLAKNLALPEAERYARQAAKELNQDDHVARERQWYQQKVDLFTARDPKHKPLPFYPEEAREKYRGLEAATWSTLGRVLIKQGRDAAARQALQKSLAAARTADAASAFAELAAKEGDTHTVLDALGTAILTGKADRTMVEKFQAAYRQAGMRPDPEAWLDRRYRTESRNPLEAAPYRGPAAEPRRAVLLEMVTGAACEPCISVDLAADALLHRYSRQDLVLIAHHMHAPSTDPLVNAASDQRARFYEARGAPTVILDGEAIEPGEGTGAVAGPVFDALDAAIQKRMAAAAGARIQLKRSWSGPELKVDVNVDGVEPAPGLRLQIYLVETEVSYSGENGFRLHPMVVRSAARMAEGGFELKSAPTRAGRTFAVDQVPAELQKYMDGYLAGMRTRFPGRPFTLREERYQVNRGKLAIVAVVQDVQTKRVLQSAYLPVEAPWK